MFMVYIIIKVIGGKMESIKITQNEHGQRLDRFLRKLLKKFSLNDIYKFIRKGTVKVNGKKVKENYELQLNDIVTIFLTNLVLEKEYNKSYKKINIVFEDENILIIDKPAGLLCHSASNKDDDTLIHRVLGYLENDKNKKSLTFRPALCNRLDRNTSGLIIAAKNYSTLKSINETIREKGIAKYYLCIVKGIAKEKDEIFGFLGKNETNRIAFSSGGDDKGGKKTLTKYKRLKVKDGYSLLEVELITGRFHQIRLHLSNEGLPIIGDDKYGDKETNKIFKRKYGLQYQLLLAYKLQFIHPIGTIKYLKDRSWYSVIPRSYEIIINDLFEDFYTV